MSPYRFACAFSFGGRGLNSLISWSTPQRDTVLFLALHVPADLTRAAVESWSRPRFFRKAISSGAFIPHSNLEFDEHYRCVDTSCLYAPYEYR